MLPFPIDSIGSDKEFVDYILSKQKDNGAFWPSDFCAYSSHLIVDNPEKYDTIGLSYDMTSGILLILNTECREIRHLWQDCHDKATKYLTTLEKLKPYEDIWAARLY